MGSSVAIGVGRYSSIITLLPNLLNILANSHPITPAPIISNRFGTVLKFGSNISSLVKILS